MKQMIKTCRWQINGCDNMKLSSPTTQLFVMGKPQQYNVGCFIILAKLISAAVFDGLL